MLSSETQSFPVDLQEKLTEKKVRFSGVELLRILAIFLICINHAVQTSELFIDYDYVLNVGNVFLKLMRYSGQIGNILFIICSSYFLVDSKKIKGEKALGLLLDSCCISIFILIGFLIAGYKFTALEILGQFVPDLWFIPVYVVFYAIHPLLNGAIERMNQRAHFTFLTIVAVLGMVRIFVYFADSLINNLVEFTVVYFAVAYMKRYMSNYCNSVKKNLISFCVFFGIFLVLGVVKYVVGMHVDYIKNGITLDGYFSPILLPALLSLFNLFNHIKIKNRFINYLASCSLFVYCFHENTLLRSIIRPKFYEFVFGINFDLYFVWIMLCAIGMFFGAYLLSVIYKETVHRGTVFISDKICALLTKVIDFFFNKSLNKEKESLNEPLQ